MELQWMWALAHISIQVWTNWRGQVDWREIQDSGWMFDLRAHAGWRGCSHRWNCSIPEPIHGPLIPLFCLQSVTLPLFCMSFYWLIKHCEVCEVCECATLLHVRSRDRFLWLPCSTSAWLARVLPQDGNRESSLKVACAIHIHSYSLNIIFVRWHTFDIHWYSCVKRLTLIDWSDLLLRCFWWDSIQLRLIGENYRRIVTPVITDLDVGTADSAVQSKHVFWCHWSLGCSMKVFWFLMYPCVLGHHDRTWQQRGTGGQARQLSFYSYIQTVSTCQCPLWFVCRQEFVEMRKTLHQKKPNKLGLVVTACGKEVDRDRFLSHKNIEFVKSIIPKFPWGKMLSYLGCGLQVVWIRRSVVSSRAAKNLLCLSYFGIRSTLRRTKKVLFFAPSAKSVHLRSSLGTRFPQGMPVCTCHVSEVVIDHLRATIVGESVAKRLQRTSWNIDWS